MPSTATFAFFASASNLPRLPNVGVARIASSSVVDTIGGFASRIDSICGMTVFSDELVQSTTTSGFADFSAFAASRATFTPRRFVKPETSPRSRPTFAGSMSMRADDRQSAAARRSV